MIHPKIQTQYTWTGKSCDKTSKKHAFDELKEIIGVIHNVCLRADSNYSLIDCKKDLTYKVLKYSSSRWRDMQSKQSQPLGNGNECLISTLTEPTTQNSLFDSKNQTIHKNLDANQIISNLLAPILANYQNNTKKN